MHRPSAFLSHAKAFATLAAAAPLNAVKGAADVALAFLVQQGIVAQAERENRRRSRHMKRAHRYTSYQACGLNGKRAVARRLRQIERGSLRVENGLAA